MMDHDGCGEGIAMGRERKKSTGLLQRMQFKTCQCRELHKMHPRADIFRTQSEAKNRRLDPRGEVEVAQFTDFDLKLIENCT